MKLDLLAKSAKKQIFDIPLKGSNNTILFSDLIKERHKKRKYMAINQVNFIFRPNSGLGANFYMVSLKLIDNKFGTKDVIREVTFASNVPQRIIMGYEVSFLQEENRDLYFLVSSLLKIDVRFGNLIINPSIIFTKYQHTFPFIPTTIKVLIGGDYLSMISKKVDPNNATSWMEQQDLSALATIHEHNELIEEGKVDEYNADKEKYYSGTVFDREKKPMKSSFKGKNKALDDEVEYFDDNSITSSKLRQDVLDGVEDTQLEKIEEVVEEDLYSPPVRATSLGLWESH